MQLSLSENIRSFRKQRKMTQEKLAEALGVTVGAGSVACLLDLLGTKELSGRRKEMVERGED